MKDKMIKIKDNSMVYFDDKVLGIDGRITKEINW